MSTELACNLFAQELSYDNPIVILSTLGSKALVNSANKDKLNIFLQKTDKRAFRIALSYTKDRDEALDIVQDSMIKLARSYGSKPESELTPLFYRILYNTIKDWNRSHFIKNKIFAIFNKNDSDNEHDLVLLATDKSQDIEKNAINRETLSAVEDAVSNLPERQRQAFTLRIWEGLDVKQSAQAMSCSEGSVKTHLSRAIASLRLSLDENSYEEDSFGKNN